MPTFLDRKINRFICVYGISEDLIVILSPEGIEFKPQGMKKGVHITWPEIVAASHTPEDVRSRDLGNPIAFLQAQITKRPKRDTERS
jgi:hypothetical protein